MVDARLTPLEAEDLAAWRADRAAAGTPLPEPGEPGVDDLEALEVVVDDVAVGAVVVGHDRQGGRVRTTVRTVQTTLPAEAAGEWAAVLEALEHHVVARGTEVLVAATPPDLVPRFRDAGYVATMTAHGKRLEPGAATELQEDRRVTTRPMTSEERAQFVEEVREVLRDGMERAGVLVGTGTPMDPVEAHLDRLAGEPPPEELLVTALVDDEPVGRAWGTIVESDGERVLLGNTIELFPEHRGQGLTLSFLGALRRQVVGLGVTDVRMHVYGHDRDARRTLLDEGAGIDVVHLRKDLP